MSVEGGYAEVMRWQDRITISPEIWSGKPCIKGTWIAVCGILVYLAGGMTEAQPLKDLPDLTAEDIHTCLSFAADRECRLTGSSGGSNRSFL